jgi:RNA polymerase sigma factor (sigma-70 family)
MRKAIDQYLADLAVHDPALVREWSHFRQTTSTKSLSQSGEPEYREARSLPAESAPLDLRAEQAERRGIVREAVAGLKPRDAAFVRLKFGFDGEEQNLEQIGQKYGITRERVRQRLVKILPRLARQLSPKLKLPIPKPDDEVHRSSGTNAGPNASQPPQSALAE